MSSEKGLPTWALVGCGCLGALGAVVVLAIAVGVWGVHKARQFGEAMSDPNQRTAKALTVLGAKEIPHGYHAVVALSVPFLFDIAILSDVPPDGDGRPSGFAQKGFIYLSFPSFGPQKNEMRDFLEGKTDGSDAFRRHRIQVDLQERVSHGRLDRDGDELLWACHRGRINPEEHGAAKTGLVTVLLLDCADTRQRWGVWFGPDPAPGAPAAELDLAGTVGDDSEIARFMEPIRPCR